MINVELINITFITGKDLLVSFTVTCSKCNKHVTFVDKSVSLTRWIVQCALCDRFDGISKNACIFELKDFILDTAKNIWNYSNEDMKTLEDKLGQYV